MQLTPHFTQEELCFSSTALRLGIDNTLPPTLLPNLRRLAAGLEAIRALLLNPIHVDSGFRCPALNRVVRGATTSAHLQGWAADFTCWRFGNPRNIVIVVQASPILFDQLIEEGTWVHVSFAPTFRRQILTAHFSPTGTTYSKGVV